MVYIVVGQSLNCCCYPPYLEQGSDDTISEGAGGWVIDGDVYLIGAGGDCGLGRASFVGDGDN